MKPSKHAFAVALAAAVVLLAVDSAHAAVIKITKCIPTFVANKPGATYSVAANLAAVGDCIDVTAAGVTIELNGFALTGNGTGIGINITSPKSRVAGPGGITNFDIGISDTDREVDVEDMSIASNATGGVLFSGTDGGLVASSVIVQNGMYGILLQNTTNSVVQYNPQIGQNAVVGIWVQNNSTTATLSSMNDIIGNEINQNGLGIWVGYNTTVGACPTAAPSTETVIVNNGPVDSNGVGIGLQCNTAQNSTVMHNIATTNGIDGFDGNPGCGTDFWAVDTFSTTNQPCVK
jgi:hypothetical protein